MPGMAALRKEGDVMIKQAIIVAGLVCLVLLLSACGTTQQTTSENDHLGRYAAQAAVAKGQAIDPAARQAALEEPALRFPARIGLARIEKGAVSPVPQSEAEAWLAMVKALGPGWGEFVPISPLEVALACPDKVTPMDRDQGAHRTGPRCDPTAIAATVYGIRRSARHKQLDAVLIYEVFAGNGRGSAASTVTELALVDRLLTLSTAGQADGQAQGVLVDVHNGAIYGFAASAADTSLLAAFDRAKSAVANLAEETGVMLRDLRIELAEARAERAEAGN
jgi:hypothetical protein